jgi:hypothetical protein
VPRLPSDVSAGKAAKKGAGTQVAGDEPVAEVAPQKPLGAHLAVDFGSVSADGGAIEAGGILRGHIEAGADAARARGNNPVRGAGKKTPANPTDVT